MTDLFSPSSKGEKAWLENVLNFFSTAAATQLGVDQMISLCLMKYHGFVYLFHPGNFARNPPISWREYVNFRRVLQTFASLIFSLKISKDQSKTFRSTPAGERRPDRIGSVCFLSKRKGRGNPF